MVGEKEVYDEKLRGFGKREFPEEEKEGETDGKVEFKEEVVMDSVSVARSFQQAVGQGVRSEGDKVCRPGKIREQTSVKRFKFKRQRSKRGSGGRKGWGHSKQDHCNSSQRHNGVGGRKPRYKRNRWGLRRICILSTALTPALNRVIGSRSCGTINKVGRLMIGLRVVSYTVD